MNCTVYLYTSGDELRPIIPYPTGRFFRGHFPRHFVPGYDRVVPPGQEGSEKNEDPATTAEIVVDMQNDFGSKGGMFDRAGIGISGIQEAVGPTAKVLAAARSLGSRSSTSRWGTSLTFQTWVHPSL